MNVHELLAAYDTRSEGHRGAELLGAMREADGVAVAQRLAASEASPDRLVAARLMYLLPDEGHLPALLPLLSDPDPAVASAARWAMRVQRRTSAWRTAVRGLSPEHAEAVAEWMSDEH
jgi:HEAT repeat protein